MNSAVEQLHSRAESLVAKFQQGGGRNNIDEAIALCREALELCPPNHPMRAHSLTWLSSCLSDRHSQLGDIRDIEEGIVLDRAALDLRPPGHSSHNISLFSLAMRLTTRYNQLGAMENLDEAIGLWRDGLVLFPPGNANRSMLLNNLAVTLYRRYQKLGAIEGLEEAIALTRDALVLRPPGHPERSASLNNLAVYLSVRYEKLGEIESLDEVIALTRDALALRPPGHPQRSSSLNNLASDLHTRYKELGALEDLEEAVALARDALALRPPGHPDHSGSLHNLAEVLQARHQKFGAMEDLNEAIALSQNALVLRPHGHPLRCSTLNDLAIYFYTRYEKLGAMEDLEESIALNLDVLGLRPPAHPLRFSTLNNLAGCYSVRYNKLREIEDLDAAISLAQDVLMLCPQGHPDWPDFLKNLASYLFTQFTLLDQPKDKDKERIFSLYVQLVDMPRMVSSADVFAARAWTNVAEYFHHSTTLLAYETCLQLLTHHLASLPSLPRHLTLVKNLTSSLAVDAFSACLRNHSLTTAVELLEQGRGAFLGRLARLRSPVDGVMVSGPEGKTLAGKFMELTSLIRKALDSPGAHQHDRACRLNVQLQRTVSDIRSLPGFAHFLLPLLFSDLQKAAIGGPIIIVNASKYSCDALIVLLDRDPIHIPLRITKDDVRDMASELHKLTQRAKLTRMGKYFAVVLRELWEKVVSPIVNILGTIIPFQSRVWWCPTAEFSLLPLHAAGTYRKDQPRFSDFYISSYTPSLSALIHARRQAPSGHAAHVKRFVAIGQANAMRESELHSVSSELTNIGERVRDCAAFTRIEGPASCISQVIEALEHNEWVHLACHGLPNVEQPFESAFGLYDGRLTIERIIQCDLAHPEFAYLSACHTTVGDKECPDEMIHLASAMQFVGFRSVIGTMGAVDDGQTTKITSMFYDNMRDGSGELDHTRAAWALHKTMMDVKGLPFDQRILYVHLGA